MSANAEFVRGVGQTKSPGRVVLIGPPGSGKSTVGQALATKMGVPFISAGDVLREHISRGTDIGQQAQPYLDRGQIAPDDLVASALDHRLGAPDAARGFVLDGYPRTPGQAERFDQSHRPDKVIHLDIDEQESLRRITNRAKTSGRSDDNAQVLADRWKVYRSQTAPVVDRYAQRDLVQRVDGRRPWRDL